MRYGGKAQIPILDTAVEADVVAADVDALRGAV
jgi:hypothetical protein